MDYLRLYIDPATGSMLFSVLLGAFITAGFFLRMLFIKLKTVIGGKSASSNTAGYNKYLIYSDDKRYWNSFKPILDEFEKRELDVAFWTSSEDDPVFSQEYKYVHPEFIGAGNKAFVKLNAAKADVLLSTTPGLDVLQWKRSKAVKKYVHFFHGAGSALGYRMFQLDFFDVVLTASDFQTEEVRLLEKKRKLPAKDIRVVGLPYLDALAEKLKKAEKPQNSNKVSLIAPSWGKSGFLYKFGEKLIDGLVETGYEIVFRPHPQSFTADKDVIDRLMAEFPNSENLEWNRDNDNFEVLRRSDIMISDFSGVMLDFAFIFDKPVIYADIEFDKGQYDYYFLKEEPWSLTMLPKIGMGLTIDNAAGVKDLIEECLTNPKFKETRAQAREEIWQCRGEGASNTADYIVAKLKQLEQKEENENKKESGKKAAGK